MNCEGTDLGNKETSETKPYIRKSNPQKKKVEVVLGVSSTGACSKPELRDNSVGFHIHLAGLLYYLLLLLALKGSREGTIQK